MTAARIRQLHTAMRHAGCLGRYDFVEDAYFMSSKPTYKMEVGRGDCGLSGKTWLVHLGEHDHDAVEQWAVVTRERARCDAGGAACCAWACSERWPYCDRTVAATP